MNVEGTEFDEENKGTITLAILGKPMIELEINSKENGEAKIYINYKQAQEMILSLKNVIDTMINKEIKFKSQELKNINTLPIKNDGIIGVNVVTK
ncbi:hypothetical protein HAHI6034_01110 [Hathewaya histolytica]|uniref:Uncharacterized protein n=1 Tax=Hathewaya histolytica TaxID=1498 RepID=A0A4U9QXJ4_HATHI|nr:hypothetical protein [Hathewaya histolytica]VTQ83574.1 Uncharacterised protein [Hathewaya histolytica]